MPDASTTIKVLATIVVLPGLFTALMGLGVAPVDEKMAAMAAPFIEPLEIPTKPFFCFLGTCKILGGLSLWGIGPMPEIVGRIGLIVAASCGAYGHMVVGDVPLPPIIYAGMVASLFVLDKSTSKGKKA